MCGSKDVFVSNDSKKTRRCNDCHYVWMPHEVRIAMLERTLLVRESDLAIATNYLKDYAKWPWNRKARLALKILGIK